MKRVEDFIESQKQLQEKLKRNWSHDEMKKVPITAETLYYRIPKNADPGVPVRRKLRKNREFTSFVNVLTRITSPHELGTFLRGILTARELDDLTTRIRIVEFLKAGFNQREVAEMLSVSETTVNKWAQIKREGRLLAIDPMDD